MRRTATVGVIVSAMCLASASPAQPSTAPERGRMLGAAREIIAKTRYATLVTIGEDGHPQARVVDPFAPEDELTVWLATNVRTRKVAEIRRDGRVTLAYFDPSGPSYVTLIGIATVVTDRAETATRWKEDWASLYRDGNRGDDYVLIRVRPLRLEVVSLPHRLMNDPVTWRPPSIVFAPAGPPGR